MQRIETQFAGRPLMLETGRLAKQAAGSAVAPLRRHDGAGRRHRIPQHLHPPVLPPHRRVPREDLRRRQDPGRLPQARGPALRRRDPRRRGSSTARSGRCSRRASRTKCRSSSPCSPPTRRTTPTCSASSPPRPRSACRRCRGTARIAAVRVGRVEGNWILNPTFQQLEFSTMDLVVERLGRLDRDGRGRRARGLAKPRCSRRSRWRRRGSGRSSVSRSS